MDAFQLLTLLIVAAAILSYVNYRLLRLPSSIGVMILAVGLSLLLMAASHGAPEVNGTREWVISAFSQVHFGQVLLHGMLAFLLFAGGLHINFRELGKLAVPIGLLAVGGTVGSAFLLGFGLHAILALMGSSLIPLPGCLLFGALISPTDPIAVLAIMRQVGAPKRLETVISGESIFNDGVAVVMFLTLLDIATGGGPQPGAGEIAMLLLRTAFGGALFGLAAGFLVYLMLRWVDDFEVEVLVTLALAMGTYAGAEALGLSAPIAEVVAALVIGNMARTHAMSDRTRGNLDTFWALVDSILNAVLFLLVGVTALITQFRAGYWIMAVVAVVLVLAARVVSVAAVGALVRRHPEGFWRSLAVLTWGGLRGGISLALALSLPETPYRAALVAMTYVVVVFSMGIQGLTIGPLIRRLYGQGRSPPRSRAAH